MPWLVRSVRLTSFLMPNSVVPGDTWTHVIGGDPEKTVEQRATGIRQETGAFLDGTASFVVQPGRLDWSFAPADSIQGPAAILGEFPATSERYLEPVVRWAGSERFPPARRLAIGMLLFEPTETRDSGYNRLREFIDAVPEGDTSDFLYQVNRHRASAAGLDGLRINRLAKWSVHHIQMFTLGPDALSLAAPVFFVGLDLDVNTSSDYPGPIPQGSVVRVLEDLRAGIMEVATHGDHLG